MRNFWDTIEYKNTCAEKSGDMCEPICTLQLVTTATTWRKSAGPWQMRYGYGQEWMIYHLSIYLSIYLFIYLSIICSYGKFTMENWLFGGSMSSTLFQITLFRGPLLHQKCAFQPLEILQLEPDQPATPVAQCEVRDAHVPWFQP